MHRGFMFNGYGSMFWVGLIPLVLLVLIALAVYMIFKNNKGSNQLSEKEDQQSTSKALEILDERYAKGEIEDDEYQRIKNNLKK